MAKLYIVEFERPQDSPSFGMPAAFFGPAVVTQVVDFSAGVASSNAFAATTALVRLETDATCSFFIAANPTATTSHPRMRADQTEYYLVRPGDKVSAIANS